MNNLTGFANNNHRKLVAYLLRILMAFIGITLLSVGIAFLNGADLGVDPYTALNMGISKDLNVPFGTEQLIANFIIVFFVFIFDRKMIGIGTIMNMVLVGYEIQYFLGIYNSIFGGYHGFLIIIFDLVIGIILFTLGTSLYMAPKLGVAPYDAIAPIISTRLHLPYKVVRMVQDITCLIAAWLVGGPIGPVSILIAFFAGPLISYWTNKVSQPIANEIFSMASNPTIKYATKALSKATKTSYNSLKSAYNKSLLIHQHKVINTSSIEAQKDFVASQLNKLQDQMNQTQKKYDQYKVTYDKLNQLLKGSK